MDEFVEYAPEEGEDPAEYQEMREREEAIALPTEVLDSRHKAKVKLVTASLKWVCAAKPKERSTKSGRPVRYFTQAFFTVRGNRLVLTYDAGTSPMPAGPGRGAIVEVFGRNSDEQENSDKSRTLFIAGAEVFKIRRPEEAATVGGVGVSADPNQPRQSEESRERVRATRTLRAELIRLRNELERDDTYEEAIKARYLDLSLQLARLEGREKPQGLSSASKEVPPDEASASAATDTREAELRALIAEQLADDAGNSGEVVDNAAEEADADAEILDHDDDGAELERATEPWADSSLPVGATVDPDCWDCPFRLGSTCTRANGCILE